MVTEYEGNLADYRQLQQDGKEHARTAYESLSRYVRNMSATPTDRTKRSEIQKWMKDPKRRAPNKAQYWPRPSPSGRDQLEDMQLWLSLHADELPPELEDERGRAKNHRSAKEIPEAVIRNATTHSEAAKWSQHSVGERTFSVDNQTWETDDGDGSKYEQQGNYFVGEAVCYVSLADVVRDIIKTVDSETAELLRALPTSPTARRVALKVRGRRYEKHAERQKAGLRWRGMEYMDACAKADAHMASGKKRTKVTSSAKPLPDVGVLAEYFSVEDGVLVRIKGGKGVKLGPVTSKQVRVDGVQYRLARIIYALTTGQDAGDKVVRNGEASTYRKVTGFNILRADGKWDAFIDLAGSTITVGEYASAEYATKARKIFIRSLEMGLPSVSPIPSSCGNR